MASSGDNKNLGGRPKTGIGTLVGVRLQPEQLLRLDEWIEQDGGRFSRPEAMRRLLEQAWGRTVEARGVSKLPPLMNELPE